MSENTKKSLNLFFIFASAVLFFLFVALDICNVTLPETASFLLLLLLAVCDVFTLWLEPHKRWFQISFSFLWFLAVCLRLYTILR